MKIKGNRDLLSLLVASIAVVLSQFPPAHQWFYDTELEFRLDPSFAIAPNPYSGLSFSRHYSITNVGEESGRIRALYVFIVDSEGTLLYEATAQRYRLHGVSQFGQSQWEQFSEINLGPGENWSHTVFFSRWLDNYDLSDVQEFQMRVEREEESWRFDMEEQGHDMEAFDAPMFEMSGDLLDELKSFIREKTGWFGEGEYKIFDAFVTDDDDVRILGYEFSVRGLHMSRFALYIEGFSYGLDSNLASSIVFRGEVYSGAAPQSVMDRIESLGVAQR